MSAPAGWYPDPSDPTRQRWWDGAHGAFSIDGHRFGAESWEVQFFKGDGRQI